MQNREEYYASTIAVLKSNLKLKKQKEDALIKLREQLVESQRLYVQMLEAQKLLATISDTNTQQTLDFITSMVNKVLTEIFPNDGYRIDVEKKLFAGNKPHIVMKVYDPEGYDLDIKLQNGTGLRQIVSFMYVICLIEIRKGRRLLILDERLNGLHKSAKKVIAKIIEIFVRGGFQFTFVEYSLNDLGKIYNVEKRNGSSTLVCVEGEYDDEVVFVNEVDLSSLDEDYVEEDYVEEKE